MSLVTTIELHQTSLLMGQKPQPLKPSLFFAFSGGLRNYTQHAPCLINSVERTKEQKKKNKEQGIREERRKLCQHVKERCGEDNPTEVMMIMRKTRGGEVKTGWQE